MLEPGGRFLLLLNHPLLQTPGSGWIDDHILEEQYWRVGPYLRDDPTIEEVAPGVNLPFMHRPLSRYIHVMGEVGLLIEDMDEPAPPPGFLDEAWEYGEASTIPRLMLLRARRGAVTGHGGRRTADRHSAAAPRLVEPVDASTARVLLTWLRRPAGRVSCCCSWSTRRLSFALNDPRGTLGTDTGGKLATLHMMEQRGSLDPDVGYWAAALRPRPACCTRCTTRTASATSG